ncbi:AAA family ATPase [Lyngbya sp. CCY1209]|uniref:AAA family ATPase n=1 Tax=Lyngbya sp. CCY1209 TaxID=2886103 RepID=UPI002D20B507|nr:AAA-like domain-containing protein [Lyngbya sp. CCY1209]MEB3882505.1 AAA-like domain-containing protein [Lyngbya sp. CCY1209]
MKNSNFILRLNLAPQLRRSLSLWNTFDYLRLLYWIFFFPQALRWYEENHGETGSLKDKKTWREKLELLLRNQNQIKLCLQGLILIFFTSFLSWIISQDFNVQFYWSYVLFNWLFSICLLGVAFAIKFGVSIGVGVAVAVSVIMNMVAILVNNTTSNFVVMVIVSVGFGVGISVVSSLIVGVIDAAFGFVVGVAFGVAFTFGLIFGVAAGVYSLVVGVTRFGVVVGIGSVVASGVLGLIISVMLGVVISVASLRPENWIICVLPNLISIQNRSWLFPRISSIPLPLLTTRLEISLKQDWEQGLENINRIFQYSLQFFPAIIALNRVLKQTPQEHLIYRISQLSENPVDWKLVKFLSSSLTQEIQTNFIKGLSIAIHELLFFWKKLNNEINVSAIDTRLDTQPRAIAAGFWHLHEKEPEQATQAFLIVRSLQYGEEMFILAQTLAQFKAATEPDTIAEIKVSAFPSEHYLRSATWDAMNGLHCVLKDTKLILGATSKSARSFALNRAIGKLRSIQDDANTLPQAERGLIVDIAQTWKKALERIAQEVGNISITEPVKNPYIIGDPVVGNLFIGREDIMRKLEELWVMSSHLQSIVLYGHRRMGKTSILLNIANFLGSKVKVIYVNLQKFSGGMGEVFLEISDEISETLNVSLPDEEDFLKHPSLNFKRHLKKVLKKIDTTGLIIALDEFESIEELIKLNQLPANFMTILRSFVQMSPKIAFAFAGLHTLEEMTEDYYQPFFSSVTPPIKVGFLTAAATAQILDNPDPDFPLSYEPEAHKTIYNLTHGQPYLVQLIAFDLVRRYNDQMFERGNPRDPVFTVEDVDAVINGTFFQNGRYYFTGVWGQAAEGAPHQQDVLKVLASHPEGCDRTTLQQTTGLDETALNNALETLSRHDVIIEAGGNIRIAVELFRMWVKQNQL